MNYILTKMIVVNFSLIDLFAVISIAIGLIAIFIKIFFHLDNKVDKLRENLNENQIKLGELESRFEYLKPVISILKETGEKAARETFKNWRGVKK